MSYVFISYSSHEMETATRVYTYLESKGITCWIAPRNVEAGSNYATQIVKAIKSCDALVLLASEYTNASGHVSNEVSLAFDCKKVIIPFKIQNIQFTDEYVYFLGRKHWIEAHEDMNQGLQQLYHTLLGFVKEQPLDGMPDMPGIEKTIQPEADGISAAQAYTREEIAELLMEHTEKYSYCLRSRLTDREEYLRFKENALGLFQETVQIFYYNKRLSADIDVVQILSEELTKGSNVNVRVQGLPGSAKNMILQLIFYELLYRFRKGESNYLPVYISASYYEKLPYNPENLHGQMKEFLEKECLDYLSYLSAHKEIQPVIMVEAIREHYVAKVSPETVIDEILRPLGKFNRITAVDTGLIKNRMRLKKVIPLAGEPRGYLLQTHPVPMEKKSSVLHMIRCIMKMYDYPFEAETIYELLGQMKYSQIDIFLIRLVAKELRSAYGVTEIHMTDMYYKMALNELYADEEKLKKASEELFRYVVDDTLDVKSLVYDGDLWLLPHKHGSYLEFMMAYYFSYRIDNQELFKDYSFFRTMLTSNANHFMSSMLSDSYGLQEKMLGFVIENYENFDIHQKSNGAYWIGRMTYKNLTNQAVEFLMKEFVRLKPVVKPDSREYQENYDNHFLFRAVCTGLSMQGQVQILDEYLGILIGNKVANAINRGATIEYFGDNYQMAAHDAYYLDTDLSTGVQALEELNKRIVIAFRNGKTQYPEYNLVTMLMLLQARMQSFITLTNFDLAYYIKKALENLKIYQSRPQNVISGKIMNYFASVQDDFERYVATESFDIGSNIYNKCRSLRDVKRKQWEAYGVEDPESVSEHTFSAWMLAALFLPAHMEIEGYIKSEVLDMILIHDMARYEIEGHETDRGETKETLSEKDFVSRKLFLKGTYPNVASLTYYYNIWTGYRNGININSRLARDIVLLQTVYTFCEYCTRYPEKFTKKDIDSWISEKANLVTETGYELFERLIEKNPDYIKLMEVHQNESQM